MCALIDSIKKRMSIKSTLLVVGCFVMLSMYMSLLIGVTLYFECYIISV